VRVPVTEKSAGDMGEAMKRYYVAGLLVDRF